MDEAILEGLDKFLSDFIGGSTLVPSEIEVDILEQFVSSCKSPEACEALIIDEKDIIETLASTLRKTLETNLEPIGLIHKILQSLCNIFRNCESALNQQLIELFHSVGLEAVCDDLLCLGENDITIVRLCTEIKIRRRLLSSNNSTDEEVLSRVMEKLCKVFIDYLKKIEAASQNTLSNDAVKEVRNCWNCFFVSNCKEQYGEIVLKTDLVKSIQHHLDLYPRSSVSVEDLFYIIENSCVSRQFRFSLLANKHLISSFIQVFELSFAESDHGVLRHCVMVLRNLFFEVPVNDKERWITYEHSHSLVKKSKIPALLVQIVCESENTALKFFALELASFEFVDIDDGGIFETVQSVCKLIVQFIIDAVRVPGFTLLIPQSEYYYSAYNAVSLLSRLLYSDELKQLCASNNFTQSLLTLLQSEMAVKDLVEVLSIFDNLCFLEQDIEGFTQVPKDLSLLVDFLVGKQKSVPERFKWVVKLLPNKNVEAAAKSLSDGICIVEDGKIEKREVVELTGKHCQKLGNKNVDMGSSYVMLSYNWHSKEQVRVLAAKIRECGFKVWIDDERMDEYGDINDGMADAVENCHLLLAVVCGNYKMSKNCRRELEYADNQNKPFVFVKRDLDFQPNGWLGLMMAKKLYYNLDPENLEKSCELIIKAIKTYFSDDKVSNSVPQCTKSESSSVSPTGSRPSTSVSEKSKTSTRVMSHDEYKDWVKKNSSVKFLRKNKNKKLFNEFVISALVDQIKQEPQQQVLDYMENKFDISVTETMTLYKVLQTAHW